MQPLLDHLWIIPLLPLLGSAVSGLFGKTWPNKIVNGVALGSTGLSFAFALEAVREFFVGGQQPFRKEFFDWIIAGNFRAGFDLQLDQLTVVMLLVVTGVGFLIHIYSTGYMAHEGGYYRFFSYLNLFMFFMLILVLAANFVLLFVGWEGVGLCSYLLIGFYFLRKSASDAGKKAFIVNRIGDFGFMLGMFLLFRTFHTLDFSVVFKQVAELQPEAMGQFGTLTVAALLLFVGATGKSAQIPLYVWLPDAMEGPTPVSALIHAATMVTAGVYVVARSHILYTHAPTAMYVVAIVGCATAFFAATIGLVQSDIKKVLAYSTVSQLGYMFLGCGVGAFSAGIFHLMTHAFFKALLFLAAGIAIHALTGEQDIRKMRGVGKLMPYTKWVFLAGSLALVGIFPFAGFFSKDSIISSCLQHGTYGALLWLAGIIGAFLTGVYTFRLFFIVFTGEPSEFAREHYHAHHGKEGPISMLWPVGVLAVLSCIGGFIQWAPLWTPLTTWLSPVAAPLVEPTSTQEWATSAIAMAIGLAGIGVAYLVYGARSIPLPKTWPLLEKKFYWDELYDFLWYRSSDAIARGLYAIIEQPYIAGSIAAVSGLAGEGSRELSAAQTGLVRTYVLALASGIAILAFVFLAAR